MIQSFSGTQSILHPQEEAITHLVTWPHLRGGVHHMGQHSAPGQQAHGVVHVGVALGPWKQLAHPRDLRPRLREVRLDVTRVLARQLWRS